MEIGEYFDIWVLMWSTKFSTREKVVGFFLDKVLWVGLGLGLGSKVVFRAVFDIFRLIILEAHGGRNKFPDFHTSSYTIIQKCGEGASLSELASDNRAWKMMWMLTMAMHAPAMKKKTHFVATPL